MFEVGSEYNVVTLEYGQNYEGKWATYETSSQYEVAAVEGTLVKLLGPDFSDSSFDHLLAGQDRSQPRLELIINTTSMFFVRAEKVQSPQDSAA